MFHAIQLSKSDPTPLYIQLASELASLIQADVLQDGFKLPTIRLLSKQLSINRDTVVSAYKLLEQQGLVESHIGRGTYITRHTQTTELPLFPSISTQTQFCCSQLKPPSALFPLSLCESLTQEIIAKEGWEAFSDPLFRHRSLLKQSISSYFEALGIRHHFAQIKITSKYNEFLLSLYKFFPKTGICVENIRDLTTSCQLQSFGAKIHEIPLLEDGLDLQALEKVLRTGTISYIIVSPYLHNPTGLCYSKANKKALLALAETYDCYIIEDGSYCEYLSDPSSYMPLFNLSDKHRVIYMYHFSRSYLPSLKYSFFILPSIFNARITEDSVSGFNERFLHYYIDSDAFMDLKTTLCHITHERYQKVIRAISENSAFLTLTHIYGAPFLWLKFIGKDHDHFLNYLAQHQLIIAPSEMFTSSSQGSFFRLSIGDLTLEALDQVIDILIQYKE